MTMKKERKVIALRLIKPNTGQLEWLPKNPRRWDDSDEERTRKSIVEDGDFLEDRPLLVVPMDDCYVVFAGNLRREGSIKAKLTEVPCVVYYPENEDDQETVKRRALKDNGSFGSWDFDLLASDWGKMLKAIISIAFLGFAAWLFKVDFQVMLLFSIAYDLTYLRIDKDNEQH